MKTITLSVTELMLLESLIMAGKDLDGHPEEVTMLDQTIVGHRVIGPNNIITNAELATFALKIAQCFKELDPDSTNQQFEISLTERECWFIRELTDIFARINNARLGEGFTIKAKVYKLLLEYDIDSRIDEIPLLGLKEIQESEIIHTPPAATKTKRKPKK